MGMEEETLNEYVDVLEIFLNNRANKIPLTPKEIKSEFIMAKSKTPEYEQKKRSLDRILEFYSLIKLVTIQTDTTMNEVSRLDRIRKKRLLPLDERKQLIPYIDYIKTKIKLTSTKDECKKYNMVGRFRKPIQVWVDSHGDVIDENIIKSLPKYIHPTENVKISSESTEKKLLSICENPLKNYPMNNGFYVINEKLKFKYVNKQSLTFEFYGDKFQNIDINISEDFIDNENNVKNLSKDIVNINNKNITLIDMEDISVRAEDCKYRLNFKNKCESTPIEYVIPLKDKLPMFVDFLDRMIDRKINEDGDYDYDISTHEIVSTVIKSNAFGFQTDFVAKIFGKLLIEKQNLSNSYKEEIVYPLPLLIEIIESKTKINIEFENYGNKIKLQNVQMNQIVIKENSFDIIFDNFTSMNQSDISQIKSIKNSDNNEFLNDYKKLKELVNELDEKHKSNFDLIMKDFESIDIFSW